MRVREDAGCALREARRDPTVFAVLVQSEGGWLRDFFAARGAAADDAELLAADTLATAYIDRGRFRGASHEDGRGWLTALAYRRLARFNHLEATEHRSLERLGVNTYGPDPLLALERTLAAAPSPRRRFARVAPRTV